MSDVFLLGAGFSKAISDSMPLLKELSRDLKQRLDVPEALLRFGDNVELWLTYLSQPHPWRSEPQNLRDRALFLEFSQHIGTILNERTQAALNNECPEWLKKLVHWWHEHQANVISLNYDTLVERACGLVNVATNSWLSCDQLYPVVLTDVRRQSTWGNGDVESLKLYKLHGSVNWYYSGASTYFGETLYYSDVAPWGAAQDNQLVEVERQATQAASEKVPLIIPPTTEKVTYFQHETNRRTWALAGEALSNATCLICIGYSIPETDLSLRFFVNDARASNIIPLTIVNPDGRMEDHYEGLVGSAYDIQPQIGGEGAVARFVERFC